MGQATQVFHVSSKGIPSLMITSAPPDWSDVPVGTTVTHQVTVINEVPPVTYNVVGPPGMSISPTGLLTWTPQTELESQVTIVVGDAR